jgi:hypothetical protein
LKVSKDFFDFIERMDPGTRMSVMAHVRSEGDVDEEISVTIERDPEDGDFYFRFEA